MSIISLPLPCRSVVCVQGQSKHYAFVEFATPDAAQAALKAINARPGQAGQGGKAGMKR